MAGRPKHEGSLCSKGHRFLLPPKCADHPAAYSVGARDKADGVWMCRVSGVSLMLIRSNRQKIATPLSHNVTQCGYQTYVGHEFVTHSSALSTWLAICVGTSVYWLNSTLHDKLFMIITNIATAWQIILSGILRNDAGIGSMFPDG